MPIYRIYNYPWSGKLGPIVDRCLYCGESGPSFQFSSSAICCLKCDTRGEPIPRLYAAYRRRADELTRAWCLENGIDHDATVENYRRHLGEMSRDLPGPPPHGAEVDYTVYLPGRRP